MHISVASEMNLLMKTDTDPSESCLPGTGWLRRWVPSEDDAETGEQTGSPASRYSSLPSFCVKFRAALPLPHAHLTAILKVQIYDPKCPDSSKFIPRCSCSLVGPVYS